MISLLILCAGLSRAATVEQMRANDLVPVFGSPFYDYYKEPAALARLDAARADLLGALASKAGPAMEIPALPTALAALPPVAARAQFASALSAMHKFEAVEGDRRAAAAHVAAMAVERSDVELLTRLALLTKPSDRDTRDLFLDGLERLRRRLVVDAEKALATVERHRAEPLPAKTRLWMARRVAARVSRVYLPKPKP